MKVGEKTIEVLPEVSVGIRDCFSEDDYSNIRKLSGLVTCAPGAKRSAMTRATGGVPRRIRPIYVSTHTAGSPMASALIAP